MEILSKLGFKKVGEWKKQENNLFFEVGDFKKENKIVYAFVVNSYVKFIASLFDEKEIEQVLRYNAYQAYNIKYDTRTCVNDQ